MHNKTVWKKTASVATFVGILAFASACGSSDKFNTPIPETASASASPTIAETTIPTPTGPALPAGIGTPAPTGKLVSAPNGDYLQSTIKSDDPALQLNLAIMDASAQALRHADVLEAQKTAVSFMAEQGIDSPLNGGGISVDEWWAKNKDQIDPAYQDEIHTALSEGKPVILNEKWQQGKYGDKYRYITSPDKSRIYNRVITPKKVWVLENGSIAVQADISYNIPVTPGVGLRGTGIQTTSGVMAYSVTKDPATGKWLIDGYDNNVNTIEG
jgi:hypothetical protein